MRIIQEGKIPQEEEFKTTCHHCKTVFSFTKSDAKFEGVEKGVFIGEKYRYSVLCPFTNCNANNIYIFKARY